jgi:hypothetical protein
LFAAQSSYALPIYILHTYVQCFVHFHVNMLQSFRQELNGKQNLSMDFRVTRLGEFSSFWASVYLRQLLRKLCTKVNQIMRYFLIGKIYPLILTKKYLATFWVIFYKRIWSPWQTETRLSILVSLYSPYSLACTPPHHPYNIAIEEIVFLLNHCPKTSTLICDRNAVYQCRPKAINWPKVLI